MSRNKTRVFLADDDPEDRQFFSIATKDLKEFSVSLEMFEDGVQLLDNLAICELLPDIIFLDLNMPRKNGLQCLIEIRQNSRYDNVAVAIYSTSDDERDIEETFVAGANVYIVKPEDLSTLRNAIHNAIRADHRFASSRAGKGNFLLKL